VRPRGALRSAPRATIVVAAILAPQRSLRAQFATRDRAACDRYRLRDSLATKATVTVCFVLTARLSLLSFRSIRTLPVALSDQPRKRIPPVVLVFPITILLKSLRRMLLSARLLRVASRCVTLACVVCVVAALPPRLTMPLSARRLHTAATRDVPQHSATSNLLRGLSAPNVADEDPRFPAAAIAEGQQWMRANAIALDTAGFALNDTFADLAPLKTLLGSKRLVILGETSHGGGTECTWIMWVAITVAYECVCCARCGQDV